jgi:hypothetical protein
LKLSCYNKGLQNDKRRDQKQNNRQKTDEWFFSYPNLIENSVSFTAS